MKPSSFRTAAAAALAVACLGTDTEAEACHFFAEEDGVSRSAVCFTSLHAGLATLVFAPADLHYAGRREWLPPRWAWTQLWLGGIATMAGGFTSLGLAAGRDDTAHPAEDVVWSLSMVAVGGFYGSVATFSLEQYRPPQTGPDRPSALRWPLLGVVPVDGGAMLMASF